MSACGSPLSSNRRIEPAVAVKASVRPGSTTVCLVVESGGSRCCSVAEGAAGALARPPFSLAFWLAAVDDLSGGTSWACAPAANVIANASNAGTIRGWRNAASEHAIPAAFPVFAYFPRPIRERAAFQHKIATAGRHPQALRPQLTVSHS